MAITQLLARMDIRTFNRCNEDADEFDELVSFKLLAKDCYLDLCWAHCGLITLNRFSGQSYNAQAALYLSCNGIRPIQHGHAATWEPAFAINEEEVRSIFSGLAQVNIESLIAAIPNEEYIWNQFFGGEKMANPQAYYQGYFNQLLAFYQAATEHRESIIVWSD